MVVETPFAENVGFWPSYDEWQSFLQRNLKDFPQLLEYEMDLAKKVGPLSVMKPLRERIDNIKAYYADVAVSQQPVLPEAVQAVIAAWGGANRLRMWTPQQVLDEMKLSTNSGSPYFTKRKLVVEKGLLGTVSFDGNRWFTDTPDGRFQLMATLGWRGQEGGPTPEDVKQRVLWMFPMDCNILEAQVYVPLVRYCQQHNYVPTWLGNEAVDKQITQLFDRAGSGDAIVCTDFTRFDQHFGPSMQEAGLAILRGLFQKNGFEKWAEEVFPMAYRIPICYDWGRAMIGDHGEGSGSGGTSGVETTGHKSLQYEAAITAGAELNPGSMTLGDDGVLSFKGIDVDRIVELYSSHGQEMNTSKQHVSYDDCEFLRRWHHKAYRIGNVCVGVYSTMRALGKLRYMERFHDPKKTGWGPKAVAIRSLSIIENCCYHPLREEFLDFCIKRDRYRLGIDIPGFLLDINKIAKKAAADGILGYQYTDTFTARPASEWWVTKALKARA